MHHHYVEEVEANMDKKLCVTESKALMVSFYQRILSAVVVVENKNFWMSLEKFDEKTAYDFIDKMIPYDFDVTTLDTSTEVTYVAEEIMEFLYTEHEPNFEIYDRHALFMKLQDNRLPYPHRG
jgi:hypothetical protein